MLMNADQSSIMVVDIQERLLPAMHDGVTVLKNTQILLQAAEDFDMPVYVSEQYPKGLGHTATSLSKFLQNAKAEIFEKIHFSCYREADIRKAVEVGNKKQLVICGIESHVCVLQTAIEFQQAGFEVFLVTDAVSSRAQANVKIALERMQKAGVTLVSTEMVLFEWMGQAGSDRFRKLSALIK